MRGTGWKRWHALERTTERLAASAAHLGAAALRSVPDSTLLVQPIWCPDQRDSEACFPWMGCRMMYAFDGVKRSAAIPWYYARAKDSNWGKIENVGVTAASGLAALRDYGAAPIGFGPDVGYFDEPPAIARQVAQKANLDLVPIWGTNDAVVAGVCAALADGLPCGIALQADDAYRHPVDGYVGPEVNPEAGGHAVVIWGYHSVGGKRRFISPGSWGTDKFGINGVVELDESRVAGAEFACFARGVS